jgi:hypothetical protein
VSIQWFRGRLGCKSDSVYHARVILRSWASADEALHLLARITVARTTLCRQSTSGGTRTTCGGGGGDSRHGRKRGGGPSGGGTWRRTLLSTRIDLWI